ncbi:MAG: hypothetical protein HY608_03805 [Planctomycetes bacterium]|nr:hypothetical protein [Planctomycetota bacterium]
MTVGTLVLLAASSATRAAEEALEVKGNRIQVYGVLRLDAIYTDSAVNNRQVTFWANSEDPRTGAAVNKNDDGFNMHPRLTRFGVNVSRPDIPAISGASLDGKMEFDFQNGGTESRQAVRLRHGFLRVSRGDWKILAGQTADLISPLLPSTNHDAPGWNYGNLGDRRPQLRVSYQPLLLGDVRLQAEVAAVRTGAIDAKDLDADGDLDGDDSGLPMLQARAGIASLWERRIDVGLWGHRGREETSTRIANLSDSHFVTDSLGFDLTFRLPWKSTLLMEGWRGQDLADLRGGVGQNVNATTAREIRSEGGWLEIRHKTTDRLSTFTGAGLDNPRDRDLNDANRTRNQALWLGGAYDLGGGLSVGGDWTSWRTEYRYREEGTANRIGLYAAYQF